jgi:hypothetical protein
MPYSNTSIDNLNQIITKAINLSKSNNIPQKNKAANNNALPDYIIFMMKIRK